MTLFQSSISRKNIVTQIVNQPRGETIPTEVEEGKTFTDTNK